MEKAEAMARLRQMAKEARAKADACYGRKDDQGYFLYAGWSHGLEEAAELLEGEG